MTPWQADTGATLRTPGYLSSAVRARWASLDAHTEVEHLVTDDTVAAHRHSGRYLALCGVQVLTASLTARERTQCRPCHRRAAS